MPLLIAAGLAAAGSVASSVGTANAQSKANRAQALAAGQQSAQSFYNYLSSRGIDLQKISAAHPELYQSWQTLDKSKDKRDFQTWLWAHLQSHPNDAIWDEISSPTPFGTGAANTTLPSWATIGGNAAQPTLFSQLIATANPGQALTQVEQQFAQANPGAVQFYNNLKNGEGFTGTLADAVREWYKRNPGTAVDALDGGFLAQYDQIKAMQPAAGAPGAGAKTDPTGVIAPPGTTGGGFPRPTDTPLDIPTQIQNLVNQGVGTAGKIFDGTLLNDQLSALQPALDARTAAPGAIHDATIAGAKGVQEAETAAAQGVHAANIQQLANLLGVRTDAAEAIYNASNAAAGGIRDATKTGANDIYGSTLTAADKLKLAGETGSQGIYGSEMTAADMLKLAGETGSQGIYGSAIDAAKALKAAGETGANDIYGAQLTQADTFEESGREAAQQALAAQNANRARQGFVGTSSGADLNKARLLAGYIQQGAGARAAAGVDRQRALANVNMGYATNAGNAGTDLQRALASVNMGYATNAGNAGTELQRALASVGIGYASTTGNAGIELQRQLAEAAKLYATQTGQAGVNRATTVGSAQEADAQAKLQAAVQLAQSLGLSGVNLATTTGNAGVSLATGNAQADYQNAIDKMNALISDQNRKVSAIGLPYQLASSDFNLQQERANSPYAALDALLKRINSNFSIAPASGPTVTPATPQSVMNPWQIAGGALTTAGQVYSGASSSKSSDDSMAKLLDALKKLQGSGGAGTVQNTSGGSAGSSQKLIEASL